MSDQEVFFDLRCELADVNKSLKRIAASLEYGVNLLEVLVSTILDKRVDISKRNGNWKS